MLTGHRLHSDYGIKRGPYQYSSGLSQGVQLNAVLNSVKILPSELQMHYYVIWKISTPLPAHVRHFVPSLLGAVPGPHFWHASASFTLFLT